MRFDHIFCFNGWVTEGALSNPVRGPFVVFPSSLEYQQVFSEASRGIAVFIAVINGRPKIPVVIYRNPMTYSVWV